MIQRTIQIVKDKGRIWIGDSNLNRQYAVIFIKFGPTLNTPKYIKCKKDTFKIIQNEILGNLGYYPGNFKYHPKTQEKLNINQETLKIAQETLNITQETLNITQETLNITHLQFHPKNPKIACVKVPRISWILSRKLWIWPELKTLEWDILNLIC